jgi:hypothetical protein
LAAPEIELRRLISLSAAVNAVGNIATGVAGYALTFVVGFTASAALVTILGIGNPVLWLPMRVFLFVVFGVSAGIGFGFAASLGFRAGFHYLITPQKLKWITRTTTPVSSRSIRVLSAFANFFTAVNGIVRLPGMVAATSWPVGAALGIFGELSFSRLMGTALTAAFVIITSGAIRLLIVIPWQWFNQRRHARIVKHPE